MNHQKENTNHPFGLQNYLIDHRQRIDKIIQFRNNFSIYQNMNNQSILSRINLTNPNKENKTSPEQKNLHQINEKQNIPLKNNNLINPNKTIVPQYNSIDEKKIKNQLNPIVSKDHSIDEKKIKNQKNPLVNNAINSKLWYWNDTSNNKEIEMTVGLPAYKTEEIIWLALESLKNQVNINFAWELICFEEDGKSKDIIKKYIGKLPGCVRIVHRNIDPSESIYKINRFILIEKWVGIANYASDSSKIFVFQDSDDYSPPKRLFIHYEHFKNSACQYSTQPKGYFYNIFTNKYLLYDGYIQNKKICVPINPEIKITTNHLNRAIRTEVMKKIPLPIEPFLSGNDRYIYNNVISIIKLDPIHTKFIFTDDEIDPNNWKEGIFTDGYNSLSQARKKAYHNAKQKSWLIPQKKPTDLLVPAYILQKLNEISKNNLVKTISKTNTKKIPPKEAPKTILPKEIPKTISIKGSVQKNNIKLNKS